MAGEIVRSEISEIPAVFERVLANAKTIEAAGELIRAKQITSVLILARGTSDNAASSSWEVITKQYASRSISD